MGFPSTRMQIADVIKNSKLFQETNVVTGSARGAEFVSCYRGATLTSAYQPIISVAHRRIVGYESLVRAQDDLGQPISPATLFSMPESSKEHLHLDRTLRSLHIQNFSKSGKENQWLFLNLDSESLAMIKPHEGFMSSLFTISGIKPQQVVIEILENEIKDKEYLQKLISHFRSLGCLIAIDDFGAGHSNFDRIWKLEPDIVKLDRSLITKAIDSVKVKRVLARMVSLIQEAGCLVLMEGLETKKEAMVAIEVGTDLLQGFYFGKPARELIDNSDVRPLLKEIIDTQRKILKRNAQDLDKHFARFKQQYDDALNSFLSEGNLSRAASIIFTEPRAVRCFVLDENGYQIGDTIHTEKYEQSFDERFSPLLSGHSACWAAKPYHYRAMSQPNKLQVTRPYISVTGLHMCITVSKSITVDGQVLIFCCDLEWKDD